MLLEDIEDLELVLALEEELLAARDTATLLDALRGGFMAPASVVRSTASRTGSPMMSAAVDEVMEKLKSMTLLEASELVKAIEETFDVDASVGGGMMMAAPMAGGAVAGGAAGEAAAGKTEFDLVLDSFPADKKIAVLKIVREITGAGLKDAKDMVEKAPCTLKEGASKAECEEAQKKLEDAGAQVVQRAAGATMLLEDIEDLEELELELEEELLAARDTATLLDALRGGWMAPASVMRSTASRTGSPMMSAAVDEVMEKLKSMTLLEASELVKAIEETFDVDASVGGGMMMAAPMAGGAVAGGAAGEAAAEKTEFDLVLD